MDIFNNKHKQYFFLPFLTVFSLPFLLFSLFTYQALISARKAEYNYFESNNVQQSEAFLYNTLSALDRTTLNIGTHSQLTAFNLKNNSLSNQPRQLLMRYATLQPVIDDIILYYPQLEGQYHSSNGYFNETALIQQKFNLSPDQSETLLGKIQSDQVGLIRFSDRNKSRILYLSSIQSSSSSGGRVIYSLNASYLYKNLADLLHQDYVLLNADQELLMASLDLEEESLDKLVTHKPNQNLKQLIDDQLFPVVSNQVGLPFTIVSLVSKSSIVGPLRRIQILFMLGTLGLLLLGLTLSNYFANKHYRPLEQLSAKISHSLTPNQIDKTSTINNPYLLLQDDMDQLLKYQDKLTDQLLDQQNQYLSTLFRILLEGYQLTDKHLSVIQSHLPTIKDPNYAMLSWVSQAKEAVDFTNLMPQVKFEIIHIDHTSKKTLQLFLLQFDPKLIDLYTIAHSLDDYAKKICQSPYHINVGRQISSLKDLYRSFLDTLYLEESPVDPPTSIRLFQEVDEKTSINNQYTFTSQFIKLKNSLDNANLELATQTVDDLLSAAKAPNVNSTTSKTLLYELLNLMMKQAEEYQLKLPQTLLENLGATFNPYFSHDYLMNLVQEVIMQMSDRIAQDNNKKNNELLTYIATHYRDFDFSIDLLTDHFNMPHYQINQILREYTGMTFSKYTQHLRFEYVKDKLITSDEKIKDIILDSGYIDASNFTRQFRTMYGCTPGQFRSNYQNSEPTV